MDFSTDLSAFAEIVMLKKLFVGVVHVHRHSTPTWASKTSLLTLKLFVSSIWINRRSAPQVNKPFPTWGRLVSCLGLVLLSFDFSCQILAQTQIVNCDAPVQSRKRGIAVNSNMSAADFQALNPGVSWFYDWGVNTLVATDQCVDGVHPDGLEWRFEFSNRPLFLSRGRKPALESICHQ